jgi:hypothetical protein
MVASGGLWTVGWDEAFRLGGHVPALDPADAEDAIDPVAGLCGDDCPQPLGSPADRQRDAVTDGQEAVGAVDDKGDEVSAWSDSDERVAG